MDRFLIFFFEKPRRYGSAGGWDDFYSSHDTKQAALEAGKQAYEAEVIDVGFPGVVQVIDTQIKEEIARFPEE